jgi:hypothetical protein
MSNCYFCGESDTYDEHYDLSDTCDEHHTFKDQHCFFCKLPLTSEEDIDRDLCALGLKDLCKSHWHHVSLCKPCFDKEYDRLDSCDSLWFK